MGTRSDRGIQVIGLGRWQEELFARLFGAPPRGDPPAASLPGEEIADLAPALRGRRTRTRQIGIKLSPVDYEILVRAARRYGVRPSTMARMLVARGARAALPSRGEAGRC